jgi:hypothetical protein
VVPVHLYNGSLTLYDPANLTGPTLFRPDWKFAGLIRDTSDVDVIIGMDLINQIILHVDGPGGYFTLTF